MMRILLIKAEVGATSLEKLLERYRDELELIGSAESIEAGYQMIQRGQANWVLLEVGQAPTPPPPKNHLVLPSKKGHELVPFERIAWLEAQGGYTVFHLSTGAVLLSSSSLSHYEQQLPAFFYRIHKSHLVNCHKIRSFASGRVGRVVLEDGAELAVAARRRKAFLQFFQRLDLKAS